MQNTNGDVRSLLSNPLALVKASTHDPQAQLVIEDGIDRSMRHCWRRCSASSAVEGYARGIAHSNRKKM